MIVRPVIASDEAEWAALYAAYAEFYEVPQTSEMRSSVWGWLMDPNHEVSGFVAVDDDTLVGFAHVRVFARPLAAASGLYLDDLFVSPTARGKGAAPALLASAKAFAVEHGHNVVRWITAEDNARARGLYDKHANATQWVTYDMEV